MFEIKAFNRVISVAIILFLAIGVQAQTKTSKDSCYTIGKEVVDDKCPCCKGLKKYTEIGTNKIFCDAEITGKSKTFLWVSILIFPSVLFLFAIFGLRNKLKKQR